MAARRTHSRWLEAYMRFVEHSESPPSYHRWAGITLVAATLQRRVYMMRRGTKIYPNMYNVLIGPSGLSRKGEPIQIAKSFMEGRGMSNIVSIANSSTKEALVEIMHKRRQQFRNALGDFEMMSAATGMSEELSVFLGIQDIEKISQLTEWYDSRDKWVRSTKVGGKEELDGLCFNFLSAADPIWIPEILPRAASGGGLMSRMLFIVEDRKAKTIPDPDMYPIDERLRETLAADLENMLLITGEYKFNKAAKAMYSEWYVEQDSLVQAGTHPMGSMMNGYLSRRGTHIYKICMVLSACRSNDLIITEEDLSTAIDYLTALEPRMPEVYRGMVSTKFGMQIDMVYGYLELTKSASKATLLNKFSQHIDVETFEIVVKNLVARKLVQEIMQPGNDIVLRLIDPGR